MNDIPVPSPLLSVSELQRHFPPRGARLGSTGVEPVRAVDGVSFSIGREEAFGLVGESGCGKTTVARLLVGLDQPTAGTIALDGRSLPDLRRTDRKALGRRIQMVFQDSTGALNPRMTVEQIVGEPLLIHALCATRAQRRERVVALLQTVGLSAADLARRPHQFSGGQRQRIGIARALAPGPELLIADEPVSALDVSVTAKIINLFSDLRRRERLALLFVSHDLRVVRHLCDRVAVMHQGRIVEQGATATVFSQPVHPYTRALLASVPELPPIAH